MKQRFVRVANGVVTHMVQVQPEWIDLNPWPHLPGEWMACEEPVNCEWHYQADTQTWQPPAK